MRRMYEVRLQLTALGGPDRSEHFERLVDEYAKIEDVHDDLLDASFGFTECADDCVNIDIEVTVRAEDPGAAYDLTSSSVRAAIQAAEGSTPDWEVRGESIDRVISA